MNRDFNIFDTQEFNAVFQAIAESDCNLAPELFDNSEEFNDETDELSGISK